MVAVLPPASRRIAFLLVSVLLLAATCATVMAQAAPGPAPEGPAAAASEGPAGPPPEAAPAPARPPRGLYINPVWLALAMAASAFWLYLTSWVCDDARATGMDFPVYTTLMLAAGGPGVLLALLVHPVCAILVVTFAAGPFAAYIVKRNRVVPERVRFLGLHHRAALLAKIPLVNQIVAMAPKRRTARASLPLTNDEGVPLQQVVAATPSLSQAADVLMDTVLKAGATKTRRVRLQPAGDQYVSQFLLDGVLHNAEAMEAELGLQVLACVSQFVGVSKDGRLRQGSGRFHAELPGLGQVTVEAQVSAIEGKPALALSLPDWDTGLYKAGLDALGMHEAVIKRVRAALDQRRGAVIICGPPGCGKTTTLYAVVGTLDVFTTEIAVIEKRQEHEMEQVRRWTVSAQKPFAQTFQEVLRELPHVIILGELETPEEIRSALGFAADGLMMTVMKAPDAPEALLHLAKLAGGAELVERSVTCVVAQRLVRKLCVGCRELVEPSPALLKKLGIAPANAGVWYRPVGCEGCLNSGYQGRTGIFGMLILTEPVKKALHDGNAQAIRQAAGSAGFRTMYQDGISKVTAGLTTLDEVRRVLRAS